MLIYFGWPAAHEDDPERAIRAGLAILEAMVSLNSTLAAKGGPRLQVRIGMHTGPVVVTGGDEVFGETANVAARVQTAAEPDTVAVTAATQRLVAGMFVLEDLGPQALKGVREPVTLYRAVRPSGVRSRLDVASGRLTPFVGREVELATLVERWERAQDGEGQNALIQGEAGVGKSRLAYQLHERLNAVPHTWLECGATPYTVGTPFHPVIALVSQALAFKPEDTLVEKLKKLETGLGALASTDKVALMADLLGLQTPIPLQMNPDLQRHRTIDLLAEWSLALSEAQPLVVLVEDLHWCDASSLEVVGRLIEQSATARVLLLATARPEFTPQWSARQNTTTLSLQRLTKRQARDMVASLLAEKLPQDTLEALVARADGVPLYLEELTKAMVEPGAARVVEAIPATIADSLMARLDRLSAAKEVAQRAAVLGREFSYSLLAAVAGMDQAALQQGLARLAEGEIVFVRGEPPEAVYAFKHALVQEAAYDSLLKRTRQQLHGHVVDVLMATFPETAAAEPELLARHAEAAGRIGEAIAAYQRAGGQAQSRSAHEEAIRHLRKAIILLASQPEGMERELLEIQLQLTLCQSLTAAKGYAHVEVEVAYDRARVLCETTGDARLGFALDGLALFALNSGLVERACVVGARMLTIAEQTGDRHLAVSGHFDIGTAETYQGKFASALAHLETGQALYSPGQGYGAIAEDLGPPLLVWIANDLSILGWLDRAITSSGDAVDMARRLGYPFALANALFFKAFVHWRRREITGQRENAAETIALSEAHGFPLWLGLGRALYAAARVAAGESESIADLVAGLALVAETGNQGGAPVLFALLSEAYLTASQLTEARGAAAAGLAIAAQTGQGLFDSELNRLQGEIILASGGSIAEAEAHFHRALDFARAQGAKSFELSTATTLARLWRDQGKPSEARDLLAPIYAWFTEGFDTADLKDAKALLDELNV